jgi:hypothetical protein
MCLFSAWLVAVVSDDVPSHVVLGRAVFLQCGSRCIWSSLQTLRGLCATDFFGEHYAAEVLDNCPGYVAIFQSARW